MSLGKGREGENKYKRMNSGRGSEHVLVTLPPCDISAYYICVSILKITFVTQRRYRVVENEDLGFGKSLLVA